MKNKRSAFGVWMIEFTDHDGRKHSEPARCSIFCPYTNSQRGAQEFADAGSRPDDAAPPRIYLKED